MEKEKDKYLLSSVNNALRVLDLLNEKPDLGIAEISKEIGIGRAAVFRILYTLKKNEYVEKNNHSKYKLSIKFAKYGNEVISKIDIVSITKPYLRQLTQKYNETTHMAVLSQDFKNTIFLYKEVSNSTIQMAGNIGVKLPAYNTATGKMLLSGLSEEQLEYCIKNIQLSRYTKNTITDKKEFLKELEKIREKGYSSDLEESEVGLTCFAAPIKNSFGKTVAAISFSGPSFRMVKNKNKLIEAIKGTAFEISKKNGYDI
jgi:DNA-binding IclR family transcriptional regulator